MPVSPLAAAHAEGVAAAKTRFKIAEGNYGVNIRPEGLAELARLEAANAPGMMQGLGAGLKGLGTSAMGLAKRNPLMAAGALGVGALGLGGVLGSKHHEANESMPHQMLHRMGI